ncbi:hypothetical protein [Sphingomonas sp. ERG5]|uniref:hypothetical protein n=1 Tax=Sphingomonas sp. ERG5 TaxID=1381597 RepID=UPI00126A77BA|nr:hypothetical protein [Sphingomonas sp. ERG5]
MTKRLFGRGLLTLALLMPAAAANARSLEMTALQDSCGPRADSPSPEHLNRLGWASVAPGANPSLQRAWQILTQGPAGGEPLSHSSFVRNEGARTIYLILSEGKTGDKDRSVRFFHCKILNFDATAPLDDQEFDQWKGSQRPANGILDAPKRQWVNPVPGVHNVAYSFVARGSKAATAMGFHGHLLTAMVPIPAE